MGVLGDIILYPTNPSGQVPSGYAPCDGRALPMGPYNALGYLLGQTGGSSITLPDLTPPGQGVQYLMTIRGIWPSAQTSANVYGNQPAPTGTVALVAFVRGINQWLPCSGQQLPTNQYPVLAYAMGVTAPQFTVPQLTPPNSSMAYVIDAVGPYPYLVAPPGQVAGSGGSTSTTTTTTAATTTTTTAAPTTTACPT